VAGKASSGREKRICSAMLEPFAAGLFQWPFQLLLVA